MARRMVALWVAFWIAAAVLSAGFSAQAETAGADAAGVRAVFLNVGKADAALIMAGDARYLVDTGSKASAEAMLKALAFFGVDRLDGVFVTHTDSDHVGGLKALLKSGISVDRLFAPSFYNIESLEKHPVFKQAEKHALPLEWLRAGDTVAFEAQSRFTVLGPLTQDEDNENNNSLVLMLETPEGSMLLAGDMETPAEEALLTAGLVRGAAVLKVGHHGNGDASGERFVYTVRPQIAVISTDSDEEPDTPDPDVLARLWNIGAEVFVTQKATCGIQVTLSGGVASAALVDYPDGGQ